MSRDPELDWSGLFPDLDRAGGALKRQIRGALLRAIAARQLAPGARLPSGRQLAALLGVARITVVEAYQQLVDEGLLTARERSGVFVALPEPAPASLPPGAAPPQDGWERRFALRPGRTPHVSKPVDWQRYRYPFLSSELDPALFPAAEWREAVKLASSAGAIQSWSVDRIDADDPALIEQLCQQVLPRRGLWAAPAEVMITLGAQQALYLILRLFAGRQTVVGLEEPGYPDLRRMARLQTERLRRLAVDAEGAVPDADFAACELVLLTPGHQSPTSAVMPAARRQAVLRLAAARDIILVEDEYDTDLFPEGIRPPPLRALDPARRVIHVGSFSKTLSPGLRLGFVVAPPAVIAELRALRRLIMRHPPGNNQRSLACFIGLGHYRSHLRRVGLVLAERARLMDRLLPAHLPGCRTQRGLGASSVWVTGPAGLDAGRLAERARGQGVLIEPGAFFYDATGAGEASFRLGFASIGTERIAAGLAGLGRALEAMRPAPRPEPAALPG